MKFRKKPVVVDAILWTGENWQDISDFVGDKLFRDTKNIVIIKTLEGSMRADIGDWVIKGIKGEFYPCKPDIFETTYERVFD